MTKSIEQFKEYILDMLEVFPEVVSKKMFGGFIFYVEDKQIGVIIENVLYLNITTDNELKKEVFALGSNNFSYEKTIKRKDGSKEDKEIVIQKWCQIPELWMDNEILFREAISRILRQEKF